MCTSITRRRAVRVAHVAVAGGSRLAIATDTGWAPVAGAARLSEILDAEDPPLALAGLTADRDARLPEPPSFSALLDRPRRIFCVGRNYVAHRDEFQRAPSEWPEVFLRLPSTVCGPHDDVVVPANSDRFDYEGELGVVIGSGGRHITSERAADHILGYCIVNDFTAREWQHRGGQWTAGKNFDRTLPVGPALVTPDGFDPADAALSTVVNGEPLQTASTAQMIFSIAEQIAFISSWTALAPGDLIATGTPGGVGIARVPPRVLAPGDVVEVGIDGLGTIRNRLIADPEVPAEDRWSQIAAQATVGR